MQKKRFSSLVTLPAHRDFEKSFDDLLERGYTYLGTHWISFSSGVVSGFWELEIVEVFYIDEHGRVCHYHTEGSDRDRSPPPRRKR
jgi:hypothetical protein